MARRKRDAAAVIEYRNPEAPKGTLQVDDPATVKLLLDPRRQRLITMFMKPRSVKEAAEELGEVPSKLHYHVRLLDQAGVIRVVDERRAGSNTERVYQLAANRFEVAPELSTVTRAAGGATARILDRARAYGASFDDPEDDDVDTVKAIRETARPMTVAQARRFWRAVAAALDELERDLPEPKRAGAPIYGLHVMFGPLPKDDDE